MALRNFSAPAAQLVPCLTSTGKKATSTAAMLSLMRFSSVVKSERAFSTSRGSVLFVPMPQVQVSGMEYGVAFGEYHQVAHACVCRAERVYLDALGESFDDVAAAHPVDRHIVVYLADWDVVGEYVESPVALAEVEYVGVEVVAVVVRYEEYHRHIGLVLKSLDHAVGGVAVIVEYEDDFWKLDHEARVVEISNDFIHCLIRC